MKLHLTRPTTVLAGLLAAALLVLTGALTGAAAAATAPGGGSDGPTGWLRVGHLSPDTPKAQVRLTPFEGGDPTVLTEASFGDLSDYERLPVGLYSVALLPAGDADAAPMLSRSVEVTEGSARTVVATGEDDDVRATVLDDDLAPPAAGQAKVRLLSAVNGADAVDASVVGGPDLATDLGSGSATGYAEVPAQEWAITLQASGASGPGTESSVGVRAGGVYTLVALDAPDGGLELRAVKDGAGSTATGTGAMPTGGVDAGAGGLATDAATDTGHPTAASLLGAGAVVLAAAAGLAAVRRRAAA